MADGNYGTPRHACLLAQQAAEKMIKAVLIRLQVEFPRSHDLDRLRTLLPTAMRLLVDGIDLAELTEWAVESRYPGDWPELSASDARRAIEAASAVCRCLRPHAQGSA